MELPINRNLNTAVWKSWQTLKDHVNFFSQSAQQFGQFFQITADHATNQAINTFGTTLNQAKGFLTDIWQTTTQIENTTSSTIENAINTSLKDLVAQHPTFLRFLQMLGWASNHPIISLVILLFGIAFVWSIFKGIIRLIETASWSILKIPFKFIQALIKTIFLSLPKFGNFNLPKIKPVTSELQKYQNKQERLAEISHRLEAIQAEQQELLQEAANIISSNTD